MAGNKMWWTLYLFVGLVLTACTQVQPAAPTESIATQAATSVVISQVYGGGGNSGAPLTHDFVELFNRGSESVSLAGLSLQYTSATGTGNFGANSGQLTELPNVTLSPGQYYLVQQAAGAGNGDPLPTPDHIDSTPIAMAAGSGKVALVNGMTSLGCNGGSTVCDTDQLARILDLVGYGNANFFEGNGAAPTLSNTTAAFRDGGGCTDTNDNAADFSADAPAPRNTATPLHSCAQDLDVPPAVSSTSPADGASNVALTTDITITFSEPVTVAGDWYHITCSTSGTRSATVSGNGTTFTLEVTGDFAVAESCQVTLYATQITDQDDTPQPMTADYSFTFTTFEGVIKIHQIQGSGLTSPRLGQNVVVEAVVTANFGTLGGFYIQEEPDDWDDDPNTSEGIFVFVGSSFDYTSIAAGDAVQVAGTVSEYVTSSGASSQTQISQATITNLGPSPVTIEPIDVTFPLTAVTDLEAYEGMLVRLPQALVISEYFNFDRFGEIVLALPLDGQDRHYTPTNVVEPGPAANALQQEYLLRRITMDDGRSNQNPFPAIHPDGSIFDVTNTFRGGDTVKDVVGVIDNTFGLYRLHPVEYGTYTQKNPRPAEPEDVGGRLKVASFNVLNYFLTLDTGASICGPQMNLGCRGANNIEELERQRAKILAALEAIDADVVGLIELENTAGVEPMADLVAGLNALFGAGTYAYIDTGTIGTDAIKVGYVYKPAMVTPVGKYAILDSSIDSRFDDTRNRPALAQTFMENLTGERFTVVVNHLKSKGSACGPSDPDTGDGQGNCNLTRTAAAEAMAGWLNTDPTGSGDPDFLIIGDLNAYAMEDPIRALETAGYTNLIRAYQGLFAYSYVFDGQFGYLDHALANASLTPQVTGMTEWHINADEPDILDYDTTFNHQSFFAPDAYRSSDHDPVIVGLALQVNTSFVFGLLAEDVEALRIGGALNRGQANALSTKLEQASRALDRNQAHVAVSKLTAFRNQVEDFVHNGVLAPEQAASLLARVNVLLNALH